jgi:predicted dehydrogenase
MAVLIIGLGSMGRRRARVLRRLGETELFGYDKNQVRLDSAVTSLGITAVQNPWDFIKNTQLELVVISTPPNAHAKYLAHSMSVGTPAFIEASVTELSELEAIRADAGFDDHLVFPSLTMLFFSQIQKLKAVLPAIGRVLLLTYHVGQHVEDWHPWEKPQEYYVSNPETGACRELVPFEFGWLTNIFGEIVPTASHLSNIGLDSLKIASAYSIQAELGKGSARANLVIEVLSRPGATRMLKIIGDRGMISYTETSRELIVQTNLDTQVFAFPPTSESDEGINPDGPYLEELKACFSAIRTGDRGIFPNTLEEDISMLQALGRVEELAI